MARNPVLGGVARNTKGVSSIACLAFVSLVALAFWAGAIWIAQLVISAFMGR